MNEIKLTGGARIGMANASFPFATLKVSKGRLELDASIIGSLVFQPQDIISVETYSQIPIIGQGIKINHRVPNYKQKVIFWTFKNPKEVLNQIKETGFLNNINSEISTTDRQIIGKQKQGGFPIKKSVAIGAIVVWNLLFLTDFIPFFLGEKEGIPIGNGILTAVGLLFLTALLSLISTDFRRLILKEGRELNDIKKFAIFVMIISGFMLLNLGILGNIFNN
ncbi:hypothetical protein KRX57_01490 [Weeksellaceae bacterium TAE3-ERU29]|nr:hypothetical protein [Weeksellaceae bacterium TAE3-ERU29]